MLLLIDGSKQRDLYHDRDFKNIPITIVKNKIDLTDEDPRCELREDRVVVSLSAKTGEGISLLKEHLKQQMGFQQTQEGTFIARRRHLDAIARAKELIEKGLSELMEHRAGELLAEDLRLAQQALSEITGKFTSDDLLGKIFSSFCIGK